MRMVATGEQQEHSAQDKEHRHDGFAVCLERMLQRLRPCTGQERDAQQDIGEELAQDKHQATRQHTTAVIYLFINISDSRDAGHQRAGVEYHQQAQGEGTQ